MAYIGNTPSSIALGRNALYTITATAGQTVFSGTDDNGNNIDLLQAESNNVFLNGSRLVDTTDFTVSGDVLTLTSGAALNDIMVITTEQEMSNIATYTKEESDSRYFNIIGDTVTGDIAISGNIGVTGTVDGRDVATDGTKLDGVETSADVTDVTNVTAAGALMDSELTSIADVKALNQSVVSGATPTFDVANMTIDDTNLVVNDATNLQTYLEGVDHSILKDRGTGVSSSYVSTVAVGGTTFAQPAVHGEIHSDQGFFHVDYAGATGITLANLSSAATYVYIDNTNALQQQTTEPTRQDWSRKMFTMRIAVDLSTNLIIGFEYLNNPSGHYANSMRDIYSYLLAQGVPFKKDQTITGRAGDLGFDVSAGTLMEFGGTGDINNANIKSFNAVSNATFFLATRTAFDAGNNTALPKTWDNAGTLTVLGSTTVVGHRLYRFSNGNLVLQYGQGNYANINLAKSGVVLEEFVLNPILKNATFFGWWFIQSTATNTGGTTLTSFVEYTLGITGGSSSGLSGALLKGNNLSDLLDAAVSRTNLGLGTSDSPTFAEVNVTGEITTDTIAQVSTNALDLLAISTTITDTAVDVFVYDTSKDSDGGAWRKRTQATSWYNETLNTATRGSRKEFPSVAVIVAETGKVTIYDGDDPAMPMWMVFNSGTSGTQETILRFGDIGKAKALNGELFVILTNHYGPTRINFISEKALTYRDNGVHEFTEKQGLVDRNILYSEPTNHGLPYIVDANANDAAMTVLPNAPIDSATGLPIPTIAVATDGGVSVIKDDGSVVDITFSSQNVISLIDFIDTDKVIFVNDSGVARFIKVYAIPVADIAGGVGYGSGGALESYETIADGSGHDMTFHSNTSGRATKALSARNFGLDHGLILLEANIEAPSKCAISIITSDYNTGYMVGDIKLAALSDTDTTNVVGTELVTNGTFDTDTTGWTAGVYAGGSAATLSVVSSKLRVTSAGSTYGSASQGITTIVGKTYVVAVDFTKGSASNGYLWVGTSAHNGYSLANSGAMTSTQTMVMTFVATTTTTYINLNLAATNNGTGDFDNATLRLADTDRSVNANGLAVHGTITKSAVATGADLVGYSGFSASNNIIQPYNSGLDFNATDSFSVSFWVKKTGGSVGYVMDRSAGDGSSRFAIYFQNQTLLSLYTPNSDVTVSGTPADTWFQCTATRSNGVLSCFVNGVLKGTVANAQNLTISSPLILGARFNITNHLTDGSLALFRISATAPSASQIKTIYEAEKVLFQENAKATLYGTSDAVTALAHDDSTNLLHVGTSSGRSVFQGLRRVDNTTTAVGAAISASNGLVIED